MNENTRAFDSLRGSMVESSSKAPDEMEERKEAHREMTALAKGAGIFLVGTIAGNGLRYAFQMIAARGLGPGVYGALLLGIAALQVMQLLADLGLSQGVVRYTAIYEGTGDRPRVKGVILFALQTVLLSSSLLAALMVLGARSVALGFFRNPDLIPVLKLAAVALPFFCLGTILAFSFQGLQIIKYRVYVSHFIEPAARVGLAVFFLAAGGGLIGMLSSYLGGLLLALGAGLFLLGKPAPRSSGAGFRPSTNGRRSWPSPGR